MLAPDQARTREAPERLLDRADADLMLGGELLFRGKAVAFSPFARLDAPHDRVGDAGQLRGGAVGVHRLLSKRLTAVSRTFSSSLVTSVPEATSAMRSYSWSPRSAMLAPDSNTALTS